MKRLAVFIVLIFTSCSAKYEVIQSLAPGKYHILGLKDKEVIIVNNMDLTPGDVIKWRDVKRGKYASK